MGKILPILLALIGLGAGVGAGIALRPEPVVEVSIDPCGDGTAPVEHVAQDTEKDDEEDNSDSEFVKMNNQFVVPVVRNEEVVALVVMSVSIEVQPGNREVVYQREPKLRDAFLQVLFDHANAGGFDGAFTSGPNMKTLRTGLVEVSRSLIGDFIVDVLITDIARQDV